MDFLAVVLGAILGSGVSTVALDAYFGRARERRERKGETSDNALGLLGELDAAFRAVARAGGSP